MNSSFDLKDRAIFFGWIAGLLALTVMLWILTQPMQTHYLLRTVNNVFISAGDSRRISEYKPKGGGKAGLFGYWYSMYNSTDKMFVFAAFQDGILIPLGAIVSANGRVSEIIPLSAHAVQIFNSLPKSILQLYVTRIEASALVNIMNEGRNK